MKEELLLASGVREDESKALADVEPLAATPLLARRGEWPFVILGRVVVMALALVSGSRLVRGLER